MHCNQGSIQRVQLNFLIEHAQCFFCIDRSVLHVRSGQLAQGRINQRVISGLRCIRSIPGQSRRIEIDQALAAEESIKRSFDGEACIAAFIPLLESLVRKSR